MPSKPDLLSPLKKGRTQCKELPLCAGSGEGCQWQALPSPVQCEKTATRTRDLPVTSGKTLPLAPGSSRSSNYILVFRVPTQVYKDFWC